MSGPPPNYPGEIPRPPYLSNSSHEAPSASSNQSPSTSTTALPGVAMLGGPQMLSRPPNAASRLPFAPHPVHIPPINDIQPRYISDYDSAAHQEQLRLRGVVGATPTMSPIGPPAAGQKRAYRQRRKDPSCDACRERKVKCDATETSSCSECSSRSVKCQFTKETNRRMSSIKQVQDLERQLYEARQQVSLLQSQLHPEGLNTTDAASDSRPTKRRRVATFQDSAKVWKNLRLYGQDIFKTDFGNGSSEVLDAPPSKLSLPPREIAREILEDFKSSIGAVFSFVDIDFYLNHLEEICRSSSNSRSDTLAVLLGMFAIGGTTKHPEGAEESLKSLLSLVSIPTPHCNIDLIRAMTLATIALLEVNQKSLAYRLCGQAVRAAQELGLDLRLSSSSGMDKERCAMWCTLYAIEPIIAVELGLPTMFADVDHDSLKEWAGEQLLDRQHNQLHISLEHASAAISINKASRSPNLSDLALVTVEMQLNRCVSALPLSYQPSSKESIDPWRVLPAIQVHDLRLLFHRQQLSPANSQSSRAKGLEDCMRIVASTLDVLIRIRQTTEIGDNSSSDSPDERPGWQEEIAVAATTFFCLHIWRSFLFLTAYGHYDAAKVCAEICAAIGPSKSINAPCGRYAHFFLQWCTEERQSQTGALVEDEELLAYLSADMQSNPEHAWAWQEDTDIEKSTSQLALEDEKELEIQDGAWERVVEKLRTIVKRNPKALKAILPLSRSDAGASSGQQMSPSNRISIADII